MKRTRKGRVFVTASLVRRLVTIALILLIGVGTTSVVIVKVNKEKASKQILDSEKTLDSQNKQIKQEDLEKEEEKDKKIILFNDLEEEITWDQEYPSNPPSVKKATITIKPGPSYIGGDITYDGNKHILSTLGEAANGTMMYYVSESKLTPDKSLFTAYDEILNPEVLHKTGCGNYYVWYYAKGDAGYNDSSIDKIGPINIKGTPTNFNGQPETYTSPMAYTAEEQPFLIQGLEAYPAGSGVVKYAFGKDLTTPPDISEFIYTFETLKAKDIGTYYIWYFVDGDESHDNSDFVPLNQEMVIEKVYATCDPLPQGKNLLETGLEQILVVPPTNVTPGCTVKYAISDTKAGAAYSSLLPKATISGAYTIWWYIDGGTTYKSTEPQCVLSTITDINLPKAIITESPKAITGLSEKNPKVNQQLVTAGTCNAGSIKYSFGTELTPNDDWSTDVNTMKAKEAGDYYVWYFADGIVNGQKTHQPSDKHFIKVTIAERQATINRHPKAIQGLIADGSSKTLIEEGSASTGIFKYCVRTDSLKPNQNEYSSTIPTGINVGTYHVWYYAEGDGTVGSSDPTYIDVIIGQGKITYTNPPTANNHVYTGSKIKLANTNGITVGTWMYAVSEENSQPSLDSFQTSVPEKTEVGTYYVWYYLKGTNLLIDSDVDFVISEITKSTSTVTSAPTAIVNEYDGTGKDIASIGQASQGATMMYHVSTSIISNIESYIPVFKTTIDRKIEPGTYYVYYYAKGNKNLYDSQIQYIETRINGTALVNPPKSVNGLLTSTVPSIDLLGDNKGSINSPAIGTVYYAVTENRMQPNSNDFAPIESYPVTKAGTYYVWYFARINGAEDTTISSVVSIIKRQAKIVTHPIVAGPDSASNEYLLTSTSNIPINSGFTQDGTFMYYLRETETLNSEPQQDKTLYSKDLPTVNHAGLYELSYYVKGDDLHEDSELNLFNNLIRVKEKATFEQHVELKPEIESNTFRFPDGTDYGTVTPYQIIQTQAQAKQPTNTNISNNNTVYYLLATEEQAKQLYFDISSNNPNSTTDPNSITVNLPGTYYLYTFIEPDPTKTIYEKSENYSIKFTIQKSIATYEQEPEVYQTLEYGIGMELELLSNPGVVPMGCNIVYAVTRGDSQPTADQFHEFSANPKFPVAKDIGTYYVWYKILGGSIYEDSAVNHQICEVTTQSSTIPFIKEAPKPNENLTYDSFSHSLIIPGEAENGEMRYYASLSNEEPSDDSMYSVLPPTAIGGGTYYIFYKVFGQSENTNAYCIQTTIARKDQTITQVPTPHESWLEGTTHRLIEVDAKSTGNTQAEYYISNSDALPPENANWVGINGTSKSTSGIYYVWYRCKQTDNYNATEPACIPVIIKKEPIVDNPVTIAHEGVSLLTFTDRYFIEYPLESFAPFSKGYSEHGDIYYYLGDVPPEDDSEYSPEPPVVDSVGFKYFWWKLFSNDALYSNVEGYVLLEVSQFMVKLDVAPSIEGAVISTASYYPSWGDDVEVPLNTVTLKDNTLKIIDGTATGGFPLKYFFGTNPQGYWSFDGSYVEVYDNTITNAGPGRYYLGYYTVVEDYTNYYNSISDNDAMWGTNFVIVDITVGSSTLVTDLEYSQNIEYDGQSHPLITKAPTYDIGVPLYAVTESNIPVSPIDNPGLFSTEIPERTEPGTYYVWYCGGESVEGYKDSEIKGVKVIIGDGVGYIVPSENLMYNGEPQVLATFVKPDTFFYYVIDSAPRTEIFWDYSCYLMGEPGFELPQKTEPGRYCISYFFEPYNPDDPDIHSLYVDIGYVEGPGITQYPQIIEGEISYDPNNKALFSNDPHTDGYIYKYAISDSNSVPPSKDQYYYTSVPQYTNAGVYNIWWYAEGDSTTHYAPTDPQCITKVVNKAESYFDVTPQGRTAPYINYAYSLLEPGWKIHDNDSNDRYLRYWVVPKGQPFVEEDYHDSIYSSPTSDVLGENIVYFYIKGNENYKDSELQSTIATVAFPEENDIVITYPSAKTENIEYTGEYQDLIDDGELSFGFRFLYGVSENGEMPPLSEFVPSTPKGLNVGNYTIYWYISGFNGVAATEIRTLNAEIKKLSVEPSEPTFEESVEYSGQAVNVVKELPEDLDGRQFSFYIENAQILIDNPYHVPSKSLFSTADPVINGVGDYTVWYYTKETANYNESTLKHTSVTVSFPSNVQTPLPVNITYDGDEHELVEIDDPEIGTYEYSLANEFGQATTYSPMIPTATNAGEYRIYYRLVLNNGAIMNEDYVESLITAAPTQVDRPLPEAFEHITYSGGAEQLLKTYGESSYGLIGFFVTQQVCTKDEVVFLFDNGEYLQQFGELCFIPTNDNLERAKEGAQVLYEQFKDLFESGGITFEMFFDMNIKEQYFKYPTAKEEGTYNIYYAAFPEDFFSNEGDYSSTKHNYTHIHRDAIYSIEGIKVEKESAVVTKAPTAIQDIQYIHVTPQELVTAGECTNGTMKYYASPVPLNESQINKDLFSTNIPKGVNVGTYYVYYYAAGSSPLIQDTEMCSLTEGNPVEVTITGTNAPIITAPVLKSEYTYDKTEQDVLETPASASWDGKTLENMYYVVLDANTQDTSGTQDGDWSTSPKVTNAGKYRLWYYAKFSDGSFTSSESIPFEVNKAIPSYETFPSLKEGNSLCYVPGLSDYAFFKPGTSNYGVIKYAVTDDPDEPDISEFNEWSDNILEEWINQSDQGLSYSYRLWYYIDGGDNAYSTEIEGPLEAYILISTPIDAYGIPNPVTDFSDQPDEPKQLFNNPDIGGDWMWAYCKNDQYNPNNDGTDPSTFGPQGAVGGSQDSAIVWVALQNATLTDYLLYWNNTTQAFQETPCGGLDPEGIATGFKFFESQE